MDVTSQTYGSSPRLMAPLRRTRSGNPRWTWEFITTRPLQTGNDGVLAVRFVTRFPPLRSGSPMPKFQVVVTSPWGAVQYETGPR